MVPESKTRVLSKTPLIHPRQSAFSCPECGKSLKTKNSLTFHLKYIHETKSKKLKCQQCDYRTRWPSSLRNHLLRHETPETGSKACDLCEHTFSTELDLRGHRRREHGPSIDPRNPKAPATYACELCSKRLSTRLQLSQHRAAEHPEHSSRPLCVLCGKLYRSNNALEAHLENSHGNRPVVRYECDLCGRSFRSKPGIVLHLAGHDKRFNCEQCGKRFATANLLHRHRTTRHQEDARVCCERCGKLFLELAALRRHLLSHAESREHNCPDCPATYRSASALKLHRRRLHEPRPARFDCELCGFSSLHRNSLRHHMARHDGRNNATCHLCGKVVTKAHLPLHVKLHAGERPHVCEICDKRFTTKKNLDVHWRLHVGVKPYECTKCSRRFTQPTSLKAHLKAHDKAKGGRLKKKPLLSD